MMMWLVPSTLRERQRYQILLTYRHEWHLGTKAVQTGVNDTVVHLVIRA